MLIKFKAYNDKEVWINPTYVMSINTEVDHTSKTGKVYTAVHVKGRSYLIDEPIEGVVRQIEETMEPLIWKMPQREDE